MNIRSQIQCFDSQVTSWIHTVFAGEFWRSFFYVATALGDPITIIVISGAIIATGMYVGSIRLAVSGAAIPITVAVGSLIKLLVERARPINEYSAKLGTFSFPSGHSTGSMIAYGLLAYIVFVKIPGLWGTMLAIVLLLVPVAVGISRVYLGAHYPSDVLAGWILGLIGLLIIIFVIRPL